MSQGAKWYVIHTYSGYENKVASNLEKLVENRHMSDLIQEIKVPIETVTEKKGDKEVQVERKIFPSYVLVKMIITDESWYLVRNIRGCTGFVGPSSDPVPLTEEEMKNMGVAKKINSASFEVGESVKIISGPLEDFIGTVESIDVDKNLLKVTVSMFGRDTLAELELDQAEKA